ncbi:MAG: SPOR domain-containing protein, partial [Candidatus Adiutrix sp.]
NPETLTAAPSDPEAGLIPFMGTFSPTPEADRAAEMLLIAPPPSPPSPTTSTTVGPPRTQSPPKVAPSDAATSPPNATLSDAATSPQSTPQALEENILPTDISPQADGELSPTVEVTPQAPTPAEISELEISDFWVVNISSTPNANESMRILSNVLGRDVGGQIYTYETTIGGISHYRIRIGFFNNRSEAEEVGRQVAENFKLSSPPWVVQPTALEVKRVTGEK